MACEAQRWAGSLQDQAVAEQFVGRAPGSDSAKCGYSAGCLAGSPWNESTHSRKTQFYNSAAPESNCLQKRMILPTYLDRFESVQILLVLINFAYHEP
jgi:hypothetical protein